MSNDYSVVAGNVGPQLKRGNYVTKLRKMVFRKIKDLGHEFFEVFGPESDSEFDFELRYTADHTAYEALCRLQDLDGFAVRKFYVFGHEDTGQGKSKRSKITV